MKRPEEMDDLHLANTIKWIERQARDGYLVQVGGGSFPKDSWYDEYLIYDKDVLDHFNYDRYVEVQRRRKSLAILVAESKGVLCH